MSSDLKKVYEARMNKKSFETVKNLHMNWYIHAVKALFGQLGKQLYQQLTEGERKTLASCLDRITDERDLAAGARCLVKARYKTVQQKSGKSSKPKEDYSPAFLLASNSMEDASFASEDSSLPTESMVRTRHHLINGYRLPTRISLPQNSTKAELKISQSSNFHRNESKQQLSGNFQFILDALKLRRAQNAHMRASSKSQRQCKRFERKHLTKKSINRPKTTRPTTMPGLISEPKEIRWSKALRTTEKNESKVTEPPSRMRTNLAVLVNRTKKADPKTEPGVIGLTNELRWTRSTNKFNVTKARSTSFITEPTIASLFAGLDRQSEHSNSTTPLTNFFNGARWRAGKTMFKGTQISRKNSVRKWNHNRAPVSLFTLMNSKNASILKEPKVLLEKARNRSKRSPYRLISNQVMKSDSIIIDVSYFKINLSTPLEQLPSYIPMLVTSFASLISSCISLFIRCRKCAWYSLVSEY